MNDRIRLDTDETLELAKHLERLSDDMDGLSMRLRTADYFLSQPEEASAAIYANRRKIHQLMGKIDQLAARLKQTVEAFGECDSQIKDHANAQFDVYAKANSDVLDGQ